MNTRTEEEVLSFSVIAELDRSIRHLESIVDAGDRAQEAAHDSVSAARTIGRYQHEIGFTGNAVLLG